VAFKSESFIELKKVNDQYLITISAKDHFNNYKNIINSVELSKEELDKLLTEVRQT